MKNGVFLLDLPESRENDAIGYNVYVENLISTIKSEAKMIGLVANYGSGKSTIIKMVTQHEEMKKVKFINVNLWKIRDLNQKSKNINVEDETIEIHKGLLNKLIFELPASSNKDFYKRKIDDKYRLFHISLKDKNDIYSLYILFAFFLFNVIEKVEIFDFNVPKICNYIIDITVALGVVNVLSRAKLYLSYDKDTSKRKINESDTIDCFNEIISEYLSDDLIEDVVICIEDLDRYNSSEFVIKILEQIYKFYSFNNERVKFIISLKPPYLLLRDSLEQDNKIISDVFSENQEGKENHKVVDENIVKYYKELYEKIFDVIINLQTITFQDYDTVLLELISKKENALKELGITIPQDENNIGIWNYLYKGSNVSIRDIKHRFNYFIILYENLNEHRKKLSNPNLININIETCLFASYLEDEFNTEFYELLNNSSKFEKIVSEYLSKNTFSQLLDGNAFDEKIKYALKNGIINSDYSMYFYKYPKGKTIYNIFDNAIQNAIFRNSKIYIPDFETYCSMASRDVIIKAIERKCKANDIPDIIFENKILFECAEFSCKDAVYNYLSKNFIFSSENGLKQVQKMLKKILKLENQKMLIEYFGILHDDLKLNYDDDQIINYRKEIIKIAGLNSDNVILFGNDMPLITLNEILDADKCENILNAIAQEKIDDSIYDLLTFVTDHFNIGYKALDAFLNKISTIDSNVFKKIFYMFNLKKYNRTNKYQLFKKNYSVLSLDDLSELQKFVSHLEIFPKKSEEEITKKLQSMPTSERSNIENIYVEMLKSVNKISAITKNYISKFACYHVYTEEIEIQLYNEKFFSHYCYSKFHRLKHFVYEKDKFENLKSCFITLFLDEKNITNYKIDIEILQYIKSNIDYKKLNMKRIKILATIPQKLNDLKTVYNKEYLVDDTSSDMDLENYLLCLTKIFENDEDDFITYIISLVKNKNLYLKINVYMHIRELLTKKNIRRFQSIKKYCISE